MKLLLLLGVSVLLVGSVTDRGSSLAAETASVSPDWTHNQANGISFRLGTESAERPLVVLFWATWCPYCKALMPHLQSIKLEYGENVDIVAIHFRADKSDPADYVANMGYEFLLLPNGEPIAEIYGIWGTPGVLIIDKDRRIKFDLRQLVVPQGLVDEKAKHGQKAARLAPFWAAQIRRELRQVVR